MAKIKLDPNPTFDAIVSVPIPGADASPVRFTFKWRGREDARKWLNSAQGKEDPALVFEAATGWELDDPFTADNVAKLCDTYAGAAGAIVATYLDELRGARTKN